MIKELFLAIIVGAILGLGITGGYMTISHKKQPTNKVVITQPTVIPTPTTSYQETVNDEKTTNQLLINSPEDNLLVSKESINISGVTTNDSQIIINTASKTFIGKSDHQGNFSITIILDAGLNIVKISSIDSNGNQLDKEINITYSTVKI